MTLPYFTLQFTEKSHSWHNEDVWKVSDKQSIFAIADGVTVLPFVNDPVAYGVGSKPLAETFCQKTTEYLEEKWDELSLAVIKEAYLHADKFIAELNRDREKPLATVAALVAVKNNIIYGSRLTDCGWALIRQGKIVYQTPEFWSWKTERGMDGYGILTGALEEKYIDLLETPHKPGDFLLLFSDGFENHLAEENFRSVFKQNNLLEIERQIRAVDEKLEARDDERFGKERTLIVAQLN